MRLTLYFEVVGHFLQLLDRCLQRSDEGRIGRSDESVPLHAVLHDSKWHDAGEVQVQLLVVMQEATPPRQCRCGAEHVVIRKPLQPVRQDIDEELSRRLPTEHIRASTGLQ